MKTVRQIIREVVSELADGVNFDILVPPDPKLGDYSTNIAFVLAKREHKKPTEVAEALKAELSQSEVGQIADVQVAPNGFLNFFLKPEFLQQQLKEISGNPNYGHNKNFSGKTVMIEYTDPNPFKLFHIGHLMPNIIGEAIARLYEASGARVLRINYQGDVGLHVAKAIYGMQHLEGMPDEKVSSEEKVLFLGQAYTLGALDYEEKPEAATEIKGINVRIFEKDNPQINELYEKGKRWSLDYFEIIYKKLGTKFDHYYFESEMAPHGVEIVKSHPEVFSQSDGATIFEGEKYGLHTRVFINSQGLPTYETKELGLNKVKFEQYHPDKSIIVTGNEINDYFRVLLKVMELTIPEVAAKTTHLGHGMLRLSTGKMSSRTGNVITADALIEQTKEKLPDTTPQENREKIAVGAIRYSILRQGIGQDIIFDFEKSLSVSGDAGPYLQYTYARLNSILEKAGSREIKADFLTIQEPSEMAVIKNLLEFPYAIEESISRMDPHHLTSHLYWLAVSANRFYEEVRVLDDTNDARRNARLVFLGTIAHVLKSGLGILGIQTLERI